MWDGPRRKIAKAARDAALAEHKAKAAAWEAADAKWNAWPPPPYGRTPDDDWWRAFYSVGQCVRRRMTPPRTGRFRARPPWHKAPATRIPRYPTGC